MIRKRYSHCTRCKAEVKMVWRFCPFCGELIFNGVKENGKS